MRARHRAPREGRSRADPRLAQPQHQCGAPPTLRLRLARVHSTALTILSSFPPAREGGPSASDFDAAAPARSYRAGRFTTRSKALAEGRSLINFLTLTRARGARRLQTTFSISFLPFSRASE